MAGASPRRFDSLLDVLPEPMLLASVAGEIRAVNSAFARLIAVPKAQIVGRTLSDLGWVGSAVSDYLRRCVRTSSFVFGAARFRRADGAIVDLRSEGVRFAPARGAPAGVLLRFVAKEQSSSRFVALTQKLDELTTEMVRRQRAEEDARDQRELLHVTLSSIGDAVIATNRSGELTFMNKVAEQLTGWTQQDALGRALPEVFSIVNEETRLPAEDPVSKVLALGQMVGLANHTVLIARDGTERPIDDSGAPIVDANGRLHGVVLVFRDVTEIRLAERAQAAARRSAEAANRAKDEFLAVLSHELRTPLNAILGWTRMLRHGSLPASKQIHGLAVIERNAEMQARLVEDLLDVSRITSGQLRLSYEPVSIRKVVDAAIEAVRPAAENKNLTFSTQIEAASTVRGDAARLQQVIWNLLTNAVKFTPAEGVVAVEAREDDTWVRITVRDTGEGFAESFKPFMFDAFSQADSSFARPHGGLGLGLTIVRRIVEAHGGTIDAHSAGVNQGASFTVVLPISTSESLQRLGPLGPAAPQLKGAHVLVVDDDVDSCELTRILLEEAGAAVQTSTNSREALDLVELGGVDVLLADIGMPGDDGFWLIQQVRAMRGAGGRELPVIAVTAFASARDRQAALSAGFDDHVPKPIDAAALLASIARVIRRGGTLAGVPEDR